MSLRRESSEFYPDYEFRFNAQLSRFNAFGSFVALSGAISAVMLLSNAVVDASQRISVLAAAAPRDATLIVSKTTDDFIKSVAYETVSTILRYCDRSNALMSYDLSASSGHEARHIHRL